MPALLADSKYGNGRPEDVCHCFPACFSSSFVSGILTSLTYPVTNITNLCKFVTFIQQREMHQDKMIIDVFFLKAKVIILLMICFFRVNSSAGQEIVLSAGGQCPPFTVDSALDIGNYFLSCTTPILSASALIKEMPRISSSRASEMSDQTSAKDMVSIIAGP